MSTLKFGASLVLRLRKMAKAAKCITMPQSSIDIGAAADCLISELVEMRRPLDMDDVRSMPTCLREEGIRFLLTELDTTCDDIPEEDQVCMDWWFDELTPTMANAVLRDKTLDTPRDVADFIERKSDQRLQK